jgi:hypothetical protein
VLEKHAGRRVGHSDCSCEGERHVHDDHTGDAEKLPGQDVPTGGGLRPVDGVASAHRCMRATLAQVRRDPIVAELEFQYCCAKLGLVLLTTPFASRSCPECAGLGSPSST